MTVEGIRAKILKTYADGLFLVQVMKPDRLPMRRFLADYFRRGQKKGGKQEPDPVDLQPLVFSFGVWYKKRTLDQNALHWALLTILAFEAYGEFGHEDSLHEEMLNRYSPRVKTILRGGPADQPKRSSKMSTVEMSRLIEGDFFELAELGTGVDSQYKIAEYWKTWNEWRGKQPVDPLRGTYQGIENYRKRVNFCEACGTYLGGEEHGSIAHIISRGADLADQDEDWNVFRLCDRCHTGLMTGDDELHGFDSTEAQHRVGWDKFLSKNEHLRWKYDAAQKRGN